MCNMGPETEPFTPPKKGPEHWKHDIIDGQTIGRATQELKKNHIYEQRGLNKDLDPIVMNR